MSISQCAGSVPSLAVVALHDHALNRSNSLVLSAAPAAGDATPPAFTANLSPGSLPQTKVSQQQQMQQQQPQQQQRSPSEQAEKMQRFLSILHSAIDLINEDNDVGGDDWL